MNPFINNFSDKSIRNKDFSSMLGETGEIQRQTTKHMSSLKDTIKRLVDSFPSAFENKGSHRLLDEIKLSQVPGLVALPNISRQKFSDNELFEKLTSNVLFQEDFASPTSFQRALEEKLMRPRSGQPLAWSKEAQDNIIAGLFAMTYTSFRFPLKTKEATFALFNLTQKQGSIIAEQNRTVNYIVGPAGTGKTWILTLSFMKTYDVMREKKLCGKLLVLTYNKGVNEFIKDTIVKLTSDSSSSDNSSSPEWSAFTIDGIMEHMKQLMIGKMRARKKYGCDLSALVQDALGKDFEEVLDIYRGTVSENTLLENLGYDAIFIDEAQHIENIHGKWIDQIWTKGSLLRRKLKKLKKVWIFGDKNQNLYDFRGAEKNLLTDMPAGRLKVNEFSFETLDRLLRGTNEIFERYHVVAFFPGSESSDASADEHVSDADMQESPDERVHCSYCNMKTSGVSGGKVKEKKVLWNAIGDKLAATVQRVVHKDGVSFEDIAILCVGRSQSQISQLRDILHSELTSPHFSLVKQPRNLLVVGAEEFASKCTKVRGRGWKRKNNGQIVQKKYLTVDSVRRFAGLEAEVSTK